MTRWSRIGVAESASVLAAYIQPLERLCSSGRLVRSVTHFVLGLLSYGCRFLDSLLLVGLFERSQKRKRL